MKYQVAMLSIFAISAVIKYKGMYTQSVRDKVISDSIVGTKVRNKLNKWRLGYR